MMVDQQNGIILSEVPDFSLPSENLWNFLNPHLKHWEKYSYFINEESNITMTYKDYADQALRWAKELQKHFTGSRPPTVALMLPNVIEFFPLALGCYAIGAPLCLIKPDAVKEIAEIMISETKPSVIVVDSSVFEYYKALFNSDGFKSEIYIRGQSTSRNLRTVEHVLTSGEKLDRDLAGKYDPKDVALIVFSSGTTGRPKGILFTHEAFRNGVAMLAYEEVCRLKRAGSISLHWKQTDEDGQEILLGNLPFVHAFGLQFYGIIAPMYGCKIIYFGSKSTYELVESIAQYKVTYLTLTVPIIEALSNIEGFERMKSSRILLSLGSPLSRETFEKIKRSAFDQLSYVDCYGSTEICAQLMNGKFLPNCKGRLVDFETGRNIIEPNKYGELLCKPSGMMSGYLNNPKATKEVIDQEKWFHTGDVAYFDENGIIQVVDRFKEVIQVQVGKKVMQIWPNEIEVVIKQHPSVIDCGVIGSPCKNEEFEVPRAFVIRKDNVREENLIKFVEERLPEEKRLAGGVVFVEKLPRNHLGKLVRKYLRNLVWYQ